MKDDSLSDVQPFMMIDNFSKMTEQTEFLKGRIVSVLEREIWNAAIEAAASKAEVYSYGVGIEIRKLKK